MHVDGHDFHVRTEKPPSELELIFPLKNSFFSELGIVFLTSYPEELHKVIANQ